MDAAVEIVRLAEDNFYIGYKSARKVISKGNSKLAVKGTVADAQGGAPIKGVTVTFVLYGAMAKTANVNPDFVKITAAKGGFNVKSLAAGTYQVTFKKAVYVLQTATVNVNDGELTIVNIALEKN